MRIKLIAAAVAGLATLPALAQSNVTIYGVVDANVVNSTGGRTAGGGQVNYSGVDSGVFAGSRLGFKGEENLGNGLKAIFTLEYYLAPDENKGVGVRPDATGAGASGSDSRQSFVGLSSAKFGSLTLGRQYAPSYLAEVRNDAFTAATIAPLAVLDGAGKHSTSAGTSARISNSVMYASPKFGGFSFAGGYGYGETQDTGGSDGQGQGSDGIFVAGVNYANSALNTDLVFHQRRNKTAAVVTAATGDNVNEWMLGASYDFKVVKLYATYTDMTDNNGTAAQDGSNKSWTAGATVPVGNGLIRASYGKLSWDRSGAGDNKVWALGYTHKLSKRTMLYTAYTHVKNDASALVAAGPVAATAALGEANATVVAGITHSF